MRRRSLMVCLLGLLTLPTLPSTAQPVRTTYQAVTEPVPRLLDLAEQFSRSFVPVRVYDLSGPDSVQAGAEAVFAARVNVESATLPLRVRWTFGDGTTARSLVAPHRFARPGTYDVVVRIENPRSQAADTLRVVVTPPPVPSSSGTGEHDDDAR